VGFAGLIFIAMAAWLIYLVPLYLHRHSNGLLEEIEPGEPITETVMIVRRGVPLDAPLREEPESASTPLTRRAALRELAQADRRAAHRRRVVLGVLAASTLVCLLLAALGRVPAPAALAPVAALVAFVGIARVSVVRLRADLDARASRILAEGSDAEETVALVLTAQASEAEDERSVDLAPPVEAVASLWEPIPIVKPTYVSKPLAPRTVRTIDLSAPVAGSFGRLPVTADAPDAEGDTDLDRAANA